MDKLGWFMSKTKTATSPPREGDPAGSTNRGPRRHTGNRGAVTSQEGLLYVSFKTVTYR